MKYNRYMEVWMDKPLSVLLKAEELKKAKKQN